jgi:hypothetical protein
MRRRRGEEDEMIDQSFASIHRVLVPPSSIVLQLMFLLVNNWQLCVLAGRKLRKFDTDLKIILENNRMVKPQKTVLKPMLCGSQKV